MKMHIKKMIAPIIITLFILIYYLIFILVISIMDQLPLFLKLIAGIVPVLIGGTTIVVLIERIKEIKSGEEDDLGKY